MNDKYLLHGCLWLRCVFFILVLTVVFKSSSCWRHSGELAALPHNQDIEERVGYWIDSAACAQATGKLLILCGPDGAIAPIEDLSLADDRGQAFVLGYFAQHAQFKFGLRESTQLNLIINAAGLIFLACVAYISRLPALAIGSLLLGLFKVIPGPIPGPDIPSGYLGVVCFALVPVLWAEAWRSGRLEHPFAIGILAVTSSFLASMFREPIAVIGVLLAVSILASVIWRERTDRGAVIKQVGFITLLIMSLSASAFLLTYRSARWRVPPATHVASHGFSQSLFHGLGTEKNPWGIQWSDHYGLTMMRQRYPDIPYLSPAYSKILGSFYWTHVIHEPRAVLRIYLQKLKRISQLPMTWCGINAWYASTFLIALVGWMFFQVHRPVEFSLSLALFFSAAYGLFILQGVLGIPWMKHLYPAKWISQLILLCIVDFGIVRWTDFRRGKHS